MQVAVLVELKARFDEATNVSWAKALERAGVHVVYGLVGLKTHAKCVLVVRNDDDGLRRYCHIGTGNYNSKTARLYEDLGFLTCDPAIGADVAQLFNHLTGYSRAHDYQLAARRAARHAQPADRSHRARGALRRRGRITSSSTRSADPEMVEALYAASQAGAQIDLLIRGICCLRAGVSGLSENIHVRSILGRYLEHSPDLSASPTATTAHRCTSSVRADLDAAQPRPPGRGARARRPSQAPGLAGPRCFEFAPRRRHRALGDGFRGILATAGAQPLH